MSDKKEAKEIKEAKEKKEEVKEEKKESLVEELGIDVQAATLKLLDPSLYYWKIDKRDENTGRYKYAHSVPCNRDLDIEKIVLDSERTWGGAGAYRLTMYDNEDKRNAKMKILSFEIPETLTSFSHESPEESARAVNSVGAQRDFFYREYEPKAETEVEPNADEDIEEEIKKDIKIERLLNVRNSVKPHAQERENSGGVMEMAMLNMQQTAQANQQQMQMIMQQSMKQQETSTQMFIAMMQGQNNKKSAFEEIMASPIAPKLLEVFMDKKNSKNEIVEVLKSPMVATLLEKIMTEKKETPLEKVFPAIMTQVTNTMSDLNTQFVQKMINLEKHDKEEKSSNASVQKLVAYKELWGEALSGVSELLTTYLGYKYGVKQEAQNPPAAAPKNEQTAQPAPIAPVVKRTEKEQAIDFAVKCLQAGDSANVIFVKLVEKVSDATLIEVAKDSEVMRLAKQSGGEADKLFSAIKEQYGK